MIVSSPSPRLFAVCATLLLGCGKTSKSGVDAGVTAGMDGGTVATTPPISSVQVDHGEFDTKTPDNAPKLAATTIASTLYKSPSTSSRKLGYVRLGGIVRRDADPVKGSGCKGEFYRVYPVGYACSDEFTTDLEAPLVRAASRRPDLRRPLPYRYGFVRATAPQYLRIPTRAEQERSEFQLAEHLEWYAQNEKDVQNVLLGANDVPLDRRGIALVGAKADPGFKLSTSMSLDELFGADEPDAKIPFWLEDGKRSIPNVSNFAVPDFAIFADRVRRKTGLSLVGAFDTADGDFHRRFAVTVDLRLIPATKIKPDTGSAFHGLEITEASALPLAWVLPDKAVSYKLIKGKDEAREAEPIPRRVVVPITGTARIKGGVRFYQTRKDPTRWLRAEDVAIAAMPEVWPAPADKGEKWIDISLRQQVLTLYEGKKAVYSTLVSTGRDGMKDPKTTLSTPMGSFRLKSKHIAAAMDSEENSAVSGGARAGAVAGGGGGESTATADRLLAAEKAGKKLSVEDQRRLANVKKGRDPEYGVTRRRGSLGFELRDVPWIQYFASGYALHGAYWHDVFGVPRSHGCINLAPIDARHVFMWSDPPVPEGWHGINIGAEMGEGTAVEIRE